MSGKVKLWGICAVVAVVVVLFGGRALLSSQQEAEAPFDITKESVEEYRERISKLPPPSKEELLARDGPSGNATEWKKVRGLKYGIENRAELLEALANKTGKECPFLETYTKEKAILDKELEITREKNLFRGDMTGEIKKALLHIMGKLEKLEEQSNQALAEYEKEYPDVVKEVQKDFPDEKYMDPFEYAAQTKPSGKRYKPGFNTNP